MFYLHSTGPTDLIPSFISTTYRLSQIESATRFTLNGKRGYNTLLRFTLKVVL